MKKILGLLMIIVSINIFSAEILKGDGYGKTEEIAKKDALKELSNSIEVEVKSDIKVNESLINQKYNLTSASNLILKSNNKLMGVKYKVIKKSGQYVAAASLDEDSLNQYYSKLKDLNQKVENNFKLAEAASKASDKINFLGKASIADSEKNSYTEVLVALGGRNIPSEVTSFQIAKSLLRAKAQRDQKVTMGLSISGNLNSSEKLKVSREIKNSIKDRSIVLKYVEDGYEDYFVDVKISDIEEDTTPETMVMPETYDTKISGIMSIINSNGEVVFTQNIYGESLDELEKRVSSKTALNMLSQDFYKNILSIMED